MNHRHTPLFQTLAHFHNSGPISFHVPGHKNGLLFPANAREFFDSILKLDMTELPGLDDLHAPTEAIAEAESMAADFFQADHTFFLVGGSTAGNLAMILATCSAGDKVIVQRNSHKSVMNGLELSGVRPVFIAPEYDHAVDRYTNPSLNTLRKALHQHLDAKAVVLTYPDYFGKTYAIKQMIDEVHTYDMPVLMDEAHGVHFSLGSPFPPSALNLGADVVVQSAHKMAPAMTMASFLHMKSELVSKERMARFLQMIQSSSPSYPLLASLDIARMFLATMEAEDVYNITHSASTVREILHAPDNWEILPTDDPLKITLHMKSGIAAKDIAYLFERRNIYPELVTHNQILFIHGLTPFANVYPLKNAVKSVGDQLKNLDNHATIEITKLITQDIQELALSYQEMNQSPYKQVSLHEGIGHIAAEAVIPYPPGIPVILKGEQITRPHIKIIENLIERGVNIQQKDLSIRVYT
ncbi:aminotransferase class I/II-fold pyridoxal phosphate-dependent enzyme [Virgibacillus sp. NKC19-3]|uniref:aminotransferase class I/II-fold pyridoxal phosphate-dependent enzyme n=1 Tax=Virgibacillus saliphilus TaxID=2831674 RepID=UPI001C9B2F88|nr:aminotransferase class I/II-fold pyridoxal phosphate-dependent enzyme [Virgibacillus sp. NKC19-3]MBY7141584.1 aminotransferase class I/II-fold pyridoxal phosphate-dependent enzyme [Virgibacillus sp. NKC19-3]